MIRRVIKEVVKMDKLQWTEEIPISTVMFIAGDPTTSDLIETDIAYIRFAVLYP